MVEDIIASDNFSEFNSSIATLERIHHLKQSLHDNAIKQNWDSVYNLLKRFYIELVSIIKDKEESELKPYFSALNKEYYKYRQIYNKKKYWDLMFISSCEDFEILLRNSEQAHGLGIKKTKDARFALS